MKLRGAHLASGVFVREPTLKHHFLTVILLTLTPFIAFALLMLVLYAREERRAVIHGLEDTTRALTLAVDHRFMASISTLEALATSEHLDSGNLAEFRRLCERVLPKQSWVNIILAEPSGRQVVNLRRQDAGVSLGTSRGRESFDEVVRTGRPAVQDYMRGGVSGPAVGASVPVIREQRLQYVLTAGFRPEVLSEILERQELPPDWQGSIIDRNNVIIATNDAQSLIGRPTRMRVQKTDLYEKQNIDGIDSYVAFSTSPATGWSVSVFVPSAVLDAPVRRSVLMVAGIGLGFLALGLGMSVVLSRKIAKPVEALSFAAKALGQGEPVSLPGSAIFELKQLELALLDSAALLKQRSAERDRSEEALRKTENEIRKINAELERRVLERTEELEVSNKRLREREVLAAMGTTAARIAHEIANPLNAVSTTVQLMERLLAKQDEPDEEMLRRLRDVEGEIARLRVFLKELREVSRPPKLKRAPVDLADLIREALELTQLTNKNSTAIQVERQFSPGLTPAMADRERLRQVLVNLIKNAFEAMPEGGRLTVQAYPIDRAVCVAVGDTGVGIPKDLKVFELFASSKRDGWGVGLSTVRQIVLAHGGSIDYTSEPGRGTTFKIVLPAASAEADCDATAAG